MGLISLEFPSFSTLAYLSSFYKNSKQLSSFYARLTTLFLWCLFCSCLPSLHSVPQIKVSEIQRCLVLLQAQDLCSKALIYGLHEICLNCLLCVQLFSFLILLLSALVLIDSITVLNHRTDQNYPQLLLQLGIQKVLTNIYTFSQDKEFKVHSTCFSLFQIIQIWCDYSLSSPVDPRSRLFYFTWTIYFTFIQTTTHWNKASEVRCVLSTNHFLIQSRREPWIPNKSIVCSLQTKPRDWEWSNRDSPSSQRRV